jgi:hypothetical protein
MKSKSEESNRKSSKNKSRSLMNMKMLEVVDPKSGGINKGSINMDHLVAAGIARAVAGVDEKGNAV